MHRTPATAPTSLRSRALVALAVALALATGVAPGAEATNDYIHCYGGDVQSIGNGDTGGTSFAYTWAYTTACGNLGINGKVYVGGGGYGWQATRWYGDDVGKHNRTFSTTMTQSRHYYSYNASATYKTLNE